MKLIDLLNKIANGEEVPKRIKLNNGNTFSLDTDNAYYSDDINQNSSWLSNEFIFGKKDLNEEIEIIEEDKKIEKLERVRGSDLIDLHSNSTPLEQSNAVTNLIMYLNNNINKINELIDEINKLKGDKNEK